MQIVQRYVVICAVAGLAISADSQPLPADMVGSWDISADECAAPGTSISQIDVSAGEIRTFGGKATIVETAQTGPVIFVAADYLQLEGVEDPSEERAERAYFRLTQREGRDRMSFIWKDVMAVDLVRCPEPGQ